MDEQKQIEEMAKEIEKAKKHIWASVMPQADDEDYLWHSRAIAEHLMLQGYRKLPDGAVILTSEERDEEMKEINKTLAERDELKAENAELKSKIEELKLKCAAFQMRNEVGQGISEAANNLIKNMIKVEKEKAVKEFAEKVKEKFNGYEATYYNGNEDEFHDLQEEIDELLKEWL